LLNPPNPLHRSFLWPLRNPVLLGVGLLGLTLGCNSDQIAHYRVPKEAPAAPSTPRPAMPPMPMGEKTGAPDPGEARTPTVPAPAVPQGALKWSLPKGWSDAPGGGTMRFATLKAPYPGKLEATVVVLPGPAGGELANVNRWRGQIGLPALADEASLAKSRTVLKTRAGALNVYDFTSEGQSRSRLVAGYIATPDGNTWFLKLTGDADAVAKAKPEFMTILGSLHLD
jgi:hypothetical protein